MNLDARELAASFDLEKLTPDFYANPYPTYRALREHEPVKRLPNGSWFLTRKDDLIDDFASAIPIEVIGNLLDVPQDEREPLRGWSLAILGALEPVVAPDVFARGNQAVEDFLAYLEGLVARRRAKPGNPERDV